MTGSRWVIPVASVGAATLLAACGLPVPEGVQRPGPAVERAARPGDVNVLPPGPRPDADAVAVVEGFVDAQASPRGDHAIARQYLAPGTPWDDAEATVFSGRDAALEMSPGVVTVRYRVVGRILADGSWVSAPGTVTVTYRLRREGSTWRLTEVPPGLSLSVRDRDRSFVARSVHFVAAVSDNGRLVAEPVFQPVTDDPAQALVERLLAGPSPGLAPAVRSSVPRGVELAAPVETEAGVVTVRLPAATQQLGDETRRELSAQLVWTLRELPEFVALRLRAGDRPLLVDGRDEQQRDAWSERDPTHLSRTPVLRHAAGGALRALAPGDAAVVPGERPPVDAVAVSPEGDLVAIVTRRQGSVLLSTGPLAGPYTARAVVRQVSSPSFGSGERGLWFVEAGRIRLLEPGGSVRDVRTQGGGAVTAIAVSRDGARVAVVRDATLLVGVVVDGSPGPEITGLRAVAPALEGVVDVTWEDATGLVVLARAAQQERIPVRVSVDGATVVPIARTGIQGVPTQVAAAAGAPLVVAAGGRLFVDTQQVFARGPVGTAPAYPG